MPCIHYLFIYIDSWNPLQPAHDFMRYGIYYGSNFFRIDHFVSLTAKENDFIPHLDIITSCNHHLVHAYASNDAVPLSVDQDTSLIGKSPVESIRIPDRDCCCSHIFFRYICPAVANRLSFAENLHMGNMADEAHRILRLK